MVKKIIGLAFLLAIICLVYFGVMMDSDNRVLDPDAEGLSLVTDIDTVEVTPPNILYGMVVDDYEVIEGVIRPNQTLSTLLSPFNVSYATLHEVSIQSKKVFNVNKIMASKKYTLLCGQDSLKTAKYFIYESSPKEYVVFSLYDSISVSVFEKEVELVEKSISGVIHTSLWEAMMSSGASAQLASALSDIYAWQVDFFRIQKGDRFKVIYQEEVIEGQTVGMGKVLSACFEHYGKEYYAFPFDQGKGVEYFDEEGTSLRKAFLKAPLNYTRISSRYSPRRYHPVQKRYKAHLGTDYAAPTGTPIMSVGDGVVVEAGYGQFNGNYVKVKHNSVYSTQYLHMSRIAKGIRKGTRVQQGQVIGFVGATGLASGPHLCFRFWKNGKQVDALKVSPPKSDPVMKEFEVDFNKVKDEMMIKLKQIEYEEEPQQALAKN
jgi:murein DD-endopeptidase MepM/ murein hydrolase activator NlpD